MAPQPRATCSVAVEPVDGQEALALLGELDAHLEPLYPPESRHGLTVAALRAPNVRFVLARDPDGKAQGCGGVQFLDGYAELKRMYVRPARRRGGMASAIVRFLEREAAARGYEIMRLETGIKQREALLFYERMGYARRPPFGAYRPDPVSVCMERSLRG